MVFDEKWEEFVEWTEEKGVSFFRNFSDWCNDKGISPLTLFLIPILILGVVAYILFFSGHGTGNLSVVLLDQDGKPLPGFDVTIQSSDLVTSLIEKTDVNGKADFQKISFATYSIIAKVLGGQDLSDTIDLNQADQVVTLKSIESLQATVNLKVIVDGPSDAKIELRTLNGDLDSVQQGPVVSFDVAENTTWKIVGTSQGYKQATATVTIAKSDVETKLVMEKMPDSGNLGVIVFLRKTSDPAAGIPNATVNFYQNGVLVNTLKTNEDGKTQGLPFPYGSSLTVQGVAPSFLSNSVTKTVDSEDVVSILMEDLPAGAEKAIKVIVQDSDKIRVTRPNVRLYSNGMLVEEKIPESGITSFDAQNGKLILTVYKEGFAPVQLLNPNAKDLNYITLKQNTQSESLKILVNSFNGLGEPEIPVSLLDSKNNPIGIPEKTSGLDGSVLFNDVPRGSAIVKIGDDSFPVIIPSTQKDENGINVLTVKLSPKKKKISFNVIDSFSNSSVHALITVGSTSCTITKQSCSLSVSEDVLEASASADGYDTTSFNVDFNAPNTIFLTPSNLQSSTALNFLGVFDEKGVRVSSLLPNSIYKAKYLFKDLKTNYTKAIAHIRLSTLNSQEDDTAKILGFSPNSFNFGENYASVTDNSTLISKQVNNTRFAEFQKFSGNGNQEIIVTFLTIGAKDSNVIFQHKTKYVTLNKILRNPDSEVQDDFLAPVIQSFSLPISFQGDCIKDACMTAILKSPLKQSQFLVEANIGDEVLLELKGFAPKGSKVTVSTSNPAVKVIDSNLDDSPFEADSNSDSSVTGSTLQRDFKGSIVFKSSKYAESRIKVTLQTASGTLTKSFTLQTIGKGTLQVDFTPRTINFERTTLKISVRDAQTQEPILNAKAIIGDNELDALSGKKLQVTEVGNGDYSVDFTPEKQGVIPLKVTAIGYFAFTTDIPVNVENIIEVSPSSLNLQVLQDSSSEETITVTNLLNERVTVNGIITSDTQLQYSQLSMSPQVFDLKPKEAKTISLKVIPKDNLLKTGGEKAIKLIEAFQGTVTFNARAGLLSDTQSVSVQGKGNLNLNPLGDDWTLSSTDLDFDLVLPSKPVNVQKVTVSNTGQQDLLINIQDNLKGLKVQPISAIIPIGGKQEFTVTATSLGAIYDNSCLFDDLKDSANVNFIASFKGISSLKTLKVTKRISFSGPCLPSNPIRIPSITDMYVDLLPIYKYKQNQDGSVVIQNQAGEKIAFTNALISGTQLSIPTGSDIILESSRIKPLDFQGSKWLVSFSVPVKFGLPLGYKDDSQRPLTVLYQDESFRMSYPTTAQLLNNYFNPSNFIQGFPQAQAQQLFYSGSVRLRDPVLVAQVLPNEIIKMERLTPDEKKLIASTKGIDESCFTVEQFPSLNSEVEFDTGTKVSFNSKDSQTFYWDTPTVLTLGMNNKLVAQLPVVRRIYFSQPVQTSNLATKPKFTVPAGTSFTINVCTNADESKLVHKLCLPRPSFYQFSEGSDYNKPTLTPPKCENIELQENDLINSWPLGFSSAKYPAKTLIYPRSPTDLFPIAAGVDAYGCVEFSYCGNPSKLNSYYEKDSIQGLPFLVLVKPNGETVNLKDKYLTSTYSDEFPIEFKASDRANDYKKSITLYFANTATGNLEDAGLDYDRSTIPDKSTFTKEELLPKDPNLQTWVTSSAGQASKASHQMFRDSIEKTPAYVTKSDESKNSNFIPYKITFQVPPKFIDSTTGCIKTSLSVNTKLVFTAYDPNSKLKTQDVVIPIQVIFNADGCGEKQVDALSQVRVTDGEKLFFKAINTNQYFVIYNNMQNNFGFKITDSEDRVSCVPLTNSKVLAKANAVVINCTLNNYGNGANGVITLDFGNENKRELVYVVNQPIKNEAFFIRSGSPEGFVDYSTEKNAIAFNSCESQFCSFNQTNEAITDFVRMISKKYVAPLQAAKTPDDFEKARQQIIDDEKLASSDDKKVVKSAIIRKVTTLTGFIDGTNELQRILRSSSGFLDVPITGDFKECGYYQFSAQIPWLVANPVKFEGRNKLNLAIQVKKLKGCDPILANSQILLEKFNGDNNLKSPLFYAGRESINFATFSPSNLFTKDISTLINLREPMFLLGRYSNDDSKQDTDNVNEISKTFYNEPVSQVISSRRFYDSGLCNQIFLNKVPSEATTIVGAFAAGSVLTAAITGGSSLAFSAATLGVFGTKVATAITVCTLSAGGSVLANGGSCPIYNDCLNTALLVGADVIGGGKTGLGSQAGATVKGFTKAFNPTTLRGGLTDLGIITAGVGSALLSEPEFKEFPTTGWRESTERQASVNWWTQNNQEVAIIGGLQGPKYANLRLQLTDEKTIQKILQSQGFKDDALKAAMTKIEASGFGAFIKDIKDPEIKAGIAGKLEKAVTGTKQKVSGLLSSGSSKDAVAAFRKSLQDKVAKGTIQTRQDVEKAVDTFVKGLPENPGIKASLKEELTNTIISPLTTGQFIKSLGKALIEGVIITKLVGFDVTPVRSELDYYAPSHIIVFNQPDGESSSSVEVCKDEKCSTPVFLTCEKNSACFYTLSAIQKSNTNTAIPYNVLAIGLNTNGKHTDKILGNVFEPTEPTTEEPISING